MSTPIVHSSGRVMGIRTVFLGRDLHLAAVPAANGIPQSLGRYLAKRNVVRPHLVKRTALTVIGDRQHFKTGPAHQKFRVFAATLLDVLADQNDIGPHTLGRAREVRVGDLTNDRHVGRRLHHVVKDVEQQRGHSGKQDTNPLQRIPFPCGG